MKTFEEAFAISARRGLPLDQVSAVGTELIETAERYRSLIEELRDDTKPMDLERARVISGVAQTIINSAKVEVDLVRAVSGSMPADNFFAVQEESRALPKRLSVMQDKALGGKP